MSILTKVVVFGGSSAAAAAAGVQLIPDPVANVNADGTEKTVFYPGDSRFFLVIVPDNYRLVAVRSTDGVIAATGPVIRQQEDRVLFDEKDVAASLSQLPSGVVTPTWYGKGAVLTVNKQEVSANFVPCIADLVYSYTAMQYLLTAPGYLPIGPADDDDWPIGVVLYVEALT